MANGAYLSQYQPLDYRGVVQGAGAPMAGLMGGMQQGMQMAQTMQQMRAAEQKRQMQMQALQQQEQEQMDQQALAMQAMQDPQSMQALMAMNPQMALQMQQTMGLQQEQEAAEMEREREVAGSLGSLMVSGTKRMVDSTYERTAERLRKEGDDPTSLGLPSRAEWETLNENKKYITLQDLGQQLEDYSMGPEAAAERRMQQTAADQKRADRIAEAEAEGEVESLPAIKSPGEGRKEFTNLSKKFSTVADSYRRINAAEATAAGDLALIFNYMKMLDPGSVVREGEFATAQNAAGIPERLRAQYNRVTTGERLTKATRKDFRRQASKQFEPALKGQMRREETFGRLATKSKYDPEDIVLDFIGDLRPKGKKKPAITPEQAASAEGAPGAAAAPGAGKAVVEQRTLPDGRTVVKYADGSLGVL